MTLREVIRDMDRWLKGVIGNVTSCRILVKGKTVASDDAGSSEELAKWLAEWLETNVPKMSGERIQIQLRKLKGDSWYPTRTFGWDDEDEDDDEEDPDNEDDENARPRRKKGSAPEGVKSRGRINVDVGKILDTGFKQQVALVESNRDGLAHEAEMIWSLQTEHVAQIRSLTKINMQLSEKLVQLQVQCGAGPFAPIIEAVAGIGVPVLAQLAAKKFELTDHSVLEHPKVKRLMALPKPQLIAMLELIPEEMLSLPAGEGEGAKTE